jgi:hypothetical protein
MRGKRPVVYNDHYDDITWEDVGTQVAKGTPIVGSYVDEAKAAAKATAHHWRGTGQPGQTWGERYDAALAADRARSKAFEERHPLISTGLQLSSSLGGTGLLLKGGGRIGTAVLGNFGKTLPGRIGAGALAGGATGIVQGIGAGEGRLEDRLNSALIGALLSGATGGALPVVGGAGRHGYEKYLPPILQSLPVPTRDAVVRRLPGGYPNAATAARIDTRLSSPYTGAFVGPLVDMWARDPALELYRGLVGSNGSPTR